MIKRSILFGCPSLHSAFRCKASIVAIALVTLSGFAFSTLAASDTGERIIAADDEPGNWLSHGRDYAEQRHSPLDDINQQNIQQLGLVWSYDFETARGMEATPLVEDGVLYTSGAWSNVKFALPSKLSGSS